MTQSVSSSKIQKEDIVTENAKKWVLDTFEKLSPLEVEELQNYLEYLIWKSQSTTQEIINKQDFTISESKGQPKQIIAAINKSHYVSLEDAHALIKSIKEGEIPIRFDAVFDESVDND